MPPWAGDRDVTARFSRYHQQSLEEAVARASPEALSVSFRLQLPSQWGCILGLHCGHQLQAGLPVPFMAMLVTSAALTFLSTVIHILNLHFCILNCPNMSIVLMKAILHVYMSRFIFLTQCVYNSSKGCHIQHFYVTIFF